MGDTSYWRKMGCSSHERGQLNSLHKILQIVTSAVRVILTTTKVTSVDDLTYLYKPHQLRYRENIARQMVHVSKGLRLCGTCTSVLALSSASCIWNSSPLVLLFARRGLQPVHWRRMSGFLINQLLFSYNEFPSRSSLGCSHPERRG